MLQLELECIKFKQKVYIDFDTINCSVFSQDKQCLGLINKCSLISNICKDCPHQNLIGQEIYK